MQGTQSETGLAFAGTPVQAAAPRTLPHVTLRGGRAAASFGDPGDEGDLAWARHGEAYAEVADALVTDVASTLHLVVTEGLQGEEGPRSVVLVMEKPKVAHAVAAVTGHRPNFLDHLVLLDGSVPAPGRPSPREVAADIGRTVADLYPVEASGPLAHALPSLLGLAARVALTGGDGAEGDQAFGIAPIVAEAVVREASKVGKKLRLPIGRDDLATAAQGALARALEGLGGTVSRERTKAKAA